MTETSPLIDQWRTNGQVTVPSSRTKLTLALIGVGVFTAIGVILILSDEVLIGALSVGFFGVLGIPALLIQVARLRPVVITREHVQIASREPIGWHEVTDIGVFETHGSKLIILHLAEAAATRVRASLPRVQATVFDANQRLIGGPNVSLPNTLKAGREELLVILGEAHAAAQGQPGQAH